MMYRLKFLNLRLCLSHFQLKVNKHLQSAGMKEALAKIICLKLVKTSATGLRKTCMLFLFK